MLAAKSLGIPTFSLQHGVLDEDAVGYVPVIADQMFCWGELHRRAMIAAGQDAAKLTIGGCPRLSRELLAEPGDVRRRLNIDPSHRVAMLGTSPVPPAQRRLLAEWFCDAVYQTDGVSGIVRLHPSERLEFYAEIAGEYPKVTFMDNGQFSLDESLAAADVVVVQSSGLGSDALVKRRLVVVVEIPDAPSGPWKRSRRAGRLPTSCQRRGTGRSRCEACFSTKRFAAATSPRRNGLSKVFVRTLGGSRPSGSRIAYNNTSEN